MTLPPSTFHAAKRRRSRTMMKEDAHNSPQTDAETKNIHISGRKTAARPMPELHPEPDDAILIRTPDNRRLSTIFLISGTTPFCSPLVKFRRQRENTALSAFSDQKRFTGSTRNRYIHRRTRRPAGAGPAGIPPVHTFSGPEPSVRSWSRRFCRRHTGKSGRRPLEAA